MTDKISLITVTRAQNANGYITETEATTEVFAEILSATRSEFYAAAKADIKISRIFKLRNADYNDATIVQHSSKRYRVERTYTADFEWIELSCSDIKE